MHYINKTIKSNTYDAIVIGSGISGGWAAKELTEKGLKTLLLERGRDVKHIADYPTTMKMPWEFEHLNQVPKEVAKAYKVPSTHYIFQEATLHFLVKDEEQEFVQDKPASWMRAYQVGGRSLLWARQTQRWSDYDFEGPARDGYATDWPIRYKDIAPWYSYVEKFIGVNGNKDGLASLPDGEFLPPHEMSCVEKYFKQKISENYGNDRHLIIGRSANLTKANPIHQKQGRSQCQNRNICERGCPYGGYFSSNASTIPWAQRTGRLTLRPHSLVHSIIYDEKKQKATGVRVIDTESREMIEYYAKIIFVNGSTFNSNIILMNSTSNRFPNGLGNDSGILGKFIGWHNYRGNVRGEFEGFKEFTTDGKRPNGIYVPRFRNLTKQDSVDFIRGYAAQGGSSRGMIQNNSDLGENLKASLIKQELGNWQMSLGMVGEVIMRESNHIRPHETLKDKYGMPQLRFSIEYGENEEKMIKDAQEQFAEMFHNAGFKNIQKTDNKRLPANENHEMGGIRMGNDPKNSMLNKWNQLHHCKNVFVTDGACMVSTGTQNPSLTYMALTARAVNHAVDELKRKNL
ncbi:MAG: GMC family oxidoreductase [Spirosomaceae bacterium]|nr:GMC family oxidoreductase [Spirosomataceae bacterium]